MTTESDQCLIDIYTIPCGQRQASDYGRMRRDAKNLIFRVVSEDSVRIYQEDGEEKGIIKHSEAQSSMTCFTRLPSLGPWGRRHCRPWAVREIGTQRHGLSGGMCRPLKESRLSCTLQVFKVWVLNLVIRGYRNPPKLHKILHRSVGVLSRVTLGEGKRVHSFLQGLNVSVT